MERKIVRLRVDSVFPSDQALRTQQDLPALGAAAARGDPHAMRRLNRLDEMGRSQSPSPVGIGQLQPILVYRNPDDPQRYTIITGHQRWLSAKRARLETIDAIVVADPGPGHVIKSAVENLLRDELCAVDMADALLRVKQLLEMQTEGSVPWSRVEKLLHLHERRRQRLTAILRLPEEAKKLAAWAELSERVLRPVVELLGRVPDEKITGLVAEIAHGRTGANGKWQACTSTEAQVLVDAIARKHSSACSGRKSVAVDSLERYCEKAVELAFDISQRSDLGLLAIDHLDNLRVILAELGQAASRAVSHIEGILKEVRQDSGHASSLT